MASKARIKPPTADNRSRNLLASIEAIAVITAITSIR